MGAHYKFYRLYYSTFALIGFTALIYFLLVLPSWKVFQVNYITKIIGGAVTVFGGAAVFICIWKYFFQLSGLKTLIEERKTNDLMITGIHKYVRHPLYSGTFLFIWGLWVLIPSTALLISNIIITVYTIIGISFEEKKLVNEFGEAYEKYKREVPMIIPGLGGRG